MCEQRHRNALNPFLNGLKNGLKNDMCEQSLKNLHSWQAPSRPLAKVTDGSNRGMG